VKRGLLGFLKPKEPKRRNLGGTLPEGVKRVVALLEKVKDPETDLNIVEEGLVYGITFREKEVLKFSS